MRLGDGKMVLMLQIHVSCADFIESVFRPLDPWCPIWGWGDSWKETLVFWCFLPYFKTIGISSVRQNNYCISSVRQLSQVNLDTLYPRHFFLCILRKEKVLGNFPGIRLFAAKFQNDFLSNWQFALNPSYLSWHRQNWTICTCFLYDLSVLQIAFGLGWSSCFSGCSFWNVADLQLEQEAFPSSWKKE